jgi:hypothetical protein
MSSKTLTKYRKVIAKIQFCLCNMTQSFPLILSKSIIQSEEPVVIGISSFLLSFGTENVDKS